MLSVHHTEAIHRIETALGYTFRDKRLLVQVFTRKTYMKIDPEAPDNEVLEFYGDMLLSYHVTTYFVDKFAHMLDDGLYFMRTVEQFTDMRSHYVRNQYLTDRIKQLIPNIDRLVRAQNPRLELAKDNQKAYADLFESLVGAVYLDSWRDDKLIRSFILRHLNIEPKLTEEVPSPRGIHTLPRVDISGMNRPEDGIDETDYTPADDLSEDLSEDLSKDLSADRKAVLDERPTVAEAASADEEPELDVEPVITRPSRVKPLRVKPIKPKSAELPTKTPTTTVGPDRPTTVNTPKSAPATVPSDTETGKNTSDAATSPADMTESSVRIANTAAPNIPMSALVISEPADASETVVTPLPAATTARAELEAYCRTAGYETPSFAETPPNAPHARPVASCTLRYRDSRGKPIKISLNDSGKTTEEAMEKAAAKMLKKLIANKEADMARLARMGKPVDAPVSMTPGEVAPATKALHELPSPVTARPADTNATKTVAEGVATALAQHTDKAIAATPVQDTVEVTAAEVDPAAQVAENDQNADFHRNEHRGSTVENRGITVTQNADISVKMPVLTSEQLENPLTETVAGVAEIVADTVTPITETIVEAPAETVAPTTESAAVPPAETMAPTTEAAAEAPLETVAVTTEAAAETPAETVAPTTESAAVPPLETVAVTTETTTEAPSETVAPTTESAAVPPLETVAVTTEATAEVPSETVAPTTEATAEVPSETVAPTAEATAEVPSETVAPTSEMAAEMAAKTADRPSNPKRTGRAKKPVTDKKAATDTSPKKADISAPKTAGTRKKASNTSEKSADKSTSASSKTVVKEGKSDLSEAKTTTPATKNATRRSTASKKPAAVTPETVATPVTAPVVTAESAPQAPAKPRRTRKKGVAAEASATDKES